MSTHRKLSVVKYNSSAKRLTLADIAKPVTTPEEYAFFHDLRAAHSKNSKNCERVNYRKMALQWNTSLSVLYEQSRVQQIPMRIFPKSPQLLEKYDRQLAQGMVSHITSSNLPVIQQLLTQDVNARAAQAIPSTQLPAPSNQRSERVQQDAFTLMRAAAANSGKTRHGPSAENSMKTADTEQSLRRGQGLGGKHGDKGCRGCRLLAGKDVRTSAEHRKECVFYAAFNDKNRASSDNSRKKAGLPPFTQQEIDDAKAGRGRRIAEFVTVGGDDDDNDEAGEQHI